MHLNHDILQTIGYRKLIDMYPTDIFWYPEAWPQIILQATVGLCQKIVRHCSHSH